MGKLHDAIAALLAAQLERRQDWDEAPALYQLHVSAGRPRLKEWPLDPGIWELDRPPAVLEHLAQMTAIAPVVPRTPDLHGMVFRHEAWRVLVEDPKAQPFQARRVQAMAEEHTLHTHPGRVEIRMMYAVDRAGITYQAELVRGQAHAETIVMYPGGDPAILGTVPDALDLMVQTLTGIPAQPRKEPPAEWLKGKHR